MLAHQAGQLQRECGLDILPEDFAQSTLKFGLVEVGNRKGSKMQTCLERLDAAVHCLVCQVAIMCAQAEEISRSASSEVRGRRCFLQFSTDLSHEHEEHTFCLACSRSGFLPQNVSA